MSRLDVASNHPASVTRSWHVERLSLYLLPPSSGNSPRPPEMPGTHRTITGFKTAPQVTWN
ncbi:hypothetical protein E2C01_090577 [Portunus trituberculatus]|uniref:Uncharacterized protein n=1 Tax=Portunus trituberculatus TaxID=210409 RepID=A0A5B7JF31_PORTR|nr:hypothetical protein [Portunus trituberculatus]